MARVVSGGDGGATGAGGGGGARLLLLDRFQSHAARNRHPNYESLDHAIECIHQRMYREGVNCSVRAHLHDESIGSP